MKHFESDKPLEPLTKMAHAAALSIPKAELREANAHTLLVAIFSHHGAIGLATLGTSKDDKALNGQTILGLTDILLSLAMDFQGATVLEQVRDVFQEAAYNRRYGVDTSREPDA